MSVQIMQLKLITKSCLNYEKKNKLSTRETDISAITKNSLYKTESRGGKKKTKVDLIYKI